MDDKNLKTEQPLKQPSKEYLRISQEPSHISCEPRKQLLILDLNGTLISRLKGNGRGYYVRPHYKQFLEFVFNHFTVMVWSSARQQSVQMMCKIFQQPLELVWNRDHFELEPDQYYRNTETVKDLTKAWHHFSNRHDAKDTIMLDDTISKLIYQPYNLIHIKTFDSNDIIKGAADNELLKVIRYLDVLRSQSNVANFMRNDPFNSNNYGIAVNWRLDTAMAHYSRKGRMLKIFEGSEQYKRKLAQDDDVCEEKEPAKKKRTKDKNGVSTYAKNDDPTTIPLRPQTKKKLKFIIGKIKHKKKPTK